MVVLDTDHLTALGYQSAIGRRLTERLTAAGEKVATTVVNCEEQLSGLLAAIHRQQDPMKQVLCYSDFVDRIEFLAGFLALPWDEDSARIFLRQKKERVRCGTMDLKIACIAMAHDSVLLTRNALDFARIPGLKHENWLD